MSWDINASGIGSIWSDFFPTVEIPSMSFSLPQNGLIKDEELSMKYLSDLDPTDRATKLASMRSLVDLYRNWVDDLERVVATLDSRYESAAANNIGECQRAYKRMYAGIDSLEQNDKSIQSLFCWRIVQCLCREFILQCQEVWPKQTPIVTPGTKKSPIDFMAWITAGRVTINADGDLSR